MTGLSFIRPCDFPSQAALARNVVTSSSVIVQQSRGNNATPPIVSRPNRPGTARRHHRRPAVTRHAADRGRPSQSLPRIPQYDSRGAASSGPGGPYSLCPQQGRHGSALGASRSARPFRRPPHPGIAGHSPKRPADGSSIEAYAKRHRRHHPGPGARRLASRGHPQSDVSPTDRRVDGQLVVRRVLRPGDCPVAPGVLRRA